MFVVMWATGKMYVILIGIPVLCRHYVFIIQLWYGCRMKFTWEVNRDYCFAHKLTKENEKKLNQLNAYVLWSKLDVRLRRVYSFCTRQPTGIPVDFHWFVPRWLHKCFRIDAIHWFYVNHFYSVFFYSILFQFISNFFSISLDLHFIDHKWCMQMARESNENCWFIPLHFLKTNCECIWWSATACTRIRVIVEFNLSSMRILCFDRTILFFSLVRFYSLVAHSDISTTNAVNSTLDLFLHRNLNRIRGSCIDFVHIERGKTVTGNCWRNSTEKKKQSKQKARKSRQEKAFMRD